MLWENWVLDASDNDGEPPFLFCPIEEDQTIIFGMNFMGLKPPGKLVGVIHKDGQDAVMEWVDKHQNLLEGMQDAEE